MTRVHCCFWALVEQGNCQVHNNGLFKANKTQQ